MLIPTTKENPSDAEVMSHRLMLRAGIVRQVASGLYIWLPLGILVLRKIEAIVREEMVRSGAQELLMPVVQPAELWRESQRWDKMGPEMMRMQDRHGRDFCLGPTHEEIITDLFRREIHSYKQLPCNFFQIQTKFRDEIRPRFGVMRTREFIMKDGYSFHLDQASFDETYAEMYDCYSRIFTRMQLDFRAVEADTGNIGGSNSHEFQALAEVGEDVIAYATEGDYAANIEKAVAAPPPARPEPGETMVEIATPDQTTIAQVATFLDRPAATCVKTLLVKGTESFVALVLRGDHELNVIKAEKLDGVLAPLELATESEVQAATGAQPGSVGPVNLQTSMYVDPEAAALADFVCGANRDGFHYQGVNWERDVPLEAARITDIRNVVQGDKAPDGQGTIEFLRGIEVGQIFQLGSIYSEPMQATVLDQNGDSVAPIMGCYGIGITRVVASVIEQNHDDDGICWPEPVAPVHVHILALNYGKSQAVREAADDLYQRCLNLEIEVLLDDRDERPGVKFADADLIGIPHRITIGERSLKEGNVEYRRRTEPDSAVVPFDDVLAKL
jgi:prolyl-tRNA synthetase